MAVDNSQKDSVSAYIMETKMPFSSNCIVPIDSSIKCAINRQTAVDPIWVRHRVILIIATLFIGQSLWL